MGQVIDLEKSKRFRDLTRMYHVLEQDIHAKLEALHRVNVELGNLCVELLHQEPLPSFDRLNGESGFDG